MPKEMMAGQICFILILVCMSILPILYPYNEIAASGILVIGFILCVVGGLLLTKDVNIKDISK